MFKNGLAPVSPIWSSISRLLQWITATIALLPRWQFAAEKKFPPIWGWRIPASVRSVLTSASEYKSDPNGPGQNTTANDDASFCFVIDRIDRFAECVIRWATAISRSVKGRHPFQLSARALSSSTTTFILPVTLSLSPLHIGRLPLQFSWAELMNAVVSAASCSSACRVASFKGFSTRAIWSGL